MALDRNMFTVDKYTVNASSSNPSIVSLRGDAVWVMIYNTSKDYDLYIWPRNKTSANPLIIPANTKRQIGYFEGGHVLFCRSSGGGTVAMQLWSQRNKWDSSWASDDLSVTVTNDDDVEDGIIGVPSDPTQTGSSTYTVDFPGTFTSGRNGRGFSFIADADVNVKIQLKDDAALSDAFIVKANIPFSFPPGPSTVEILTVTIEDRSGASWGLDFVGY